MPDLPSPWREFLSELDARLAESVALHCIGGFVISLFYGLPRPTGDIDYYTAIPSSPELDRLAGPGSALEAIHNVRLHRVTVTDMPEDYEERLREMFPREFEKLHLFAVDPYDLILSKLGRNSGKDRDDAAYLFQTFALDSNVLEERYRKELRPNLSLPDREDLTLRLWLEIFRGD